MQKELPESVTTLNGDLRKALGRREFTDPALKAFDQLCGRLTGWLVGKPNDVDTSATALASILDSEGLGDLAARVRLIPKELAA